MKERNSKKYEGVYSYEGKNDVSFGVRFYENGKKRSKIIGKKSAGWTEKKCDIERKRIQNDINLGAESTTARRIRKGTYTINDLFEVYRLEKEGVHRDFKRTELKYKRHVGRVFGDIDIYDISTEDIFKFRNDLVKKFSNATVNYEIGVLKTLFNIAITNKIYSKASPVAIDKKSALKVDNERNRYLNTLEAGTLIDSVKNDSKIYLFVLLSLSTGGRLKTIKNIKFKDINFENYTVTLEDFKTTSTYTGRINNTICAILRNEFIGKSKNDFVIDMPYRTIQRKLKKVMDTLFNKGLDSRDTKNRVVVHTLRHTFGSLLSINGTSIYKIQKLMNHSSIEITARYSKLGTDNGRAEVENMLTQLTLTPGNIDQYYKETVQQLTQI